MGLTCQHPNAEHSNVSPALAEKGRHSPTQGGSELEGASPCETGIAEHTLNKRGKVEHGIKALGVFCAWVVQLWLDALAGQGSALHALPAIHLCL